MEYKYALIESINNNISPLTKFETLEEAQKEMSIRFSYAMDFDIEAQDSLAEVIALFRKRYGDNSVCYSISSMQAHCEPYYVYSWEILPLGVCIKASLAEVMSHLEKFDPSDISVCFLYYLSHKKPWDDIESNLRWQEIIPLVDLYKDWYDDHECWSNIAEITSIRFYTKSGEELFVEESIMLENFINELESNLGLKKFRGIGSFIHKLENILGFQKSKE